MFGKVFEQMYTGSMVGAGTNVYSLWPYMIACCDSDGDVDVHPVAVAAILGTTPDDVKAALEYLLAKDEHSRSEEHDGARVVKVLENRYHLVNYDKYRKIKDQDERREQLRQAQRRFRAKKGLPPVIGNPDVINGNPPSSAVISRKPRAEGRGKKTDVSGNGHFVAPSYDDVEAFHEMNLPPDAPVCARAFVDYYTANGWHAGRAKIVDWKAAYKGWVRREIARHQ